MKTKNIAFCLLLVPAIAVAFQNVHRPVRVVPSPLQRSTKYHLSNPTSSKATEAIASPDEDRNEDRLLEPFGVGVARDFKARIPHFLSDIKDGLNTQCLAATMVLFFACLAPAIGFGTLYSQATGGAIGTMEMVSSTAFCGIFYSLFAAQPMVIIGGTGPVVLFSSTLAVLAHRLNLPFLPLYAWTGLWTSAILLLTAFTSASNFVKFLTRFTDEIFSTLISAIFVVDAFSNIATSFTSPTSTLVKGLLTVACAATTYILTLAIRGLRKSVYFTRGIRSTVSNFGPAIGVLAATLLAQWARLSQGNIAALSTLSMPNTFATTSGRPWLVPLLDLPVWARWAAFCPALMATVLLYLDQLITTRLVNNPRWNMVKGRRKGNVLDGMHLDMLCISITTAIQSCFGLPWLVAATVRSLSHVGATTKYGPDGQPEGIIEQRVTGTAIHTLIACCVLLQKPRQLLSNVPLAALMGLFLFLGTSSLAGNELWERITGIFKDPSVAPKERWEGKVPRKVINLYTAIQLGCLGAMLWVKQSPVGVLFPVVIAMLAPLRFALEGKIVSKKHMDVLDEE